jgi:hypothetical protein
MTFIWLVVWLIAGLPHLTAWNSWLIALVVCIALDAGEKGRWPRRRGGQNAPAGTETFAH